MDIEKHVAKYYSKLVFTSPKLTTLLLLYFAITLFIIIVKSYYFPITLVLLQTIAPLIFSNISSVILLRNSVLRFRNYLRRILVMLVFILTNTLFFEVILTIIGLKTPYLISYGGYSFLHYMVRRSEIGFPKSLIESTIPPLLYYVTLLIFFNNVHLTLLFTPFIAVLLGEAYFLILGKYSRTKKLTLALSRAFLKLWFAEDSKDIEEILEKVSINDNVWVKFFTVFDKKRGNMKGAVVLTSIHAGPFRNVGSSKIISSLRRVFKKIYGNIPIVIFHTTTTHEKDLPSKSHLQNLISYLEKFLLKKNGLEVVKGDIIYGLKTLCNKQHCVHIVDIEKVPLVILYNSSGGIDDLPSYLNDTIESIIKKAGLEDVLVIEAHNTKPEKERDIEEECKVFSEIIEKYFSGKGNVNKKGRTLKIGIAEIRNIKLNNCPDLCSDNVGTLVFEHDGKLSIIVVYDGNNASKNFKEEVERKVRMLSKDIASVIIATTDNHEKTGSLGGKTYVPVGVSSCRDEILNTTILAVKKALSTLSQSEIIFSRINITTKVLGRQGLSLLENLAKDLKLIVTLFILLNIFSFFIPPLIAFIY